MLTRFRSGVIVARKVEVGKSFEIVNWQKSWMGQIARARLVGKMTRVDDIYADEVPIWSNCSAESGSGEELRNRKLAEILDGTDCTGKARWENDQSGRYLC